MPPEAARLTVGYVLDISQSAIHGLFVTHPYERTLLWDFEVEKPVEKIVLMPMPVQQRRKRQVRAKNVKPKKKTEEQ